MPGAPRIGRPGESWSQRGARLRNDANRNKSGLLKGDSGIREHRAQKLANAEIRRAERLAKAQEMAAAEAATLPKEMAESPIVRTALLNKARVQLILNDALDENDRGVNEADKAKLEVILKIVSEVARHADDIISRLPKSEEGAVQRIPKSVSDWIDSVDLSGYEVADSAPPTPNIAPTEGESNALPG